MSRSLSFLPFSIVICLFSSFINVHAEEKIELDLQKSFDQIKSQFDNLSARINFNNIKVQQLDDAQKKYSSLEPKLTECITAKTTQLEKLKENLKLLGEKQITEEADIKTKRKDFENQSKAVDNDLKRCNLLKIELKKIIDSTVEFRLSLVKKQLLSHEISVWTAAKRLSESDASNLKQDIKTIQPLIVKTYKSASWPLLFLVLAGIASGLLWKRSSPPSNLDKSQYSSPTFFAILRGIKRTSPVLIAILFSWLYLETQSSTHDVLIQVLKFAFVLCLSFAVMRGVLFPSKPFASTGKLSKRTILLLVWSTILFSSVTFALTTTTLGRYSDSVSLYIFWLISISLSALSFIGVIWISINNFLTNRSYTPAFFIPMGILGVAIIAAILGYRNLSAFLYFGVLMTLIIIVFAAELLRISNEFFDSLDVGKNAWQKKLRMVMSVEETRAFPGVIWMRILFFFAIIFISISALMYVWGSSQQRISTLLNTLKTGFTIGSVNLDLLNIVYALLILIVALSVLPFIKNQLVSSWLKHSNLSRGAKDATQTLVGYIGIAVAIIWALSVAGVDFKNIAIIAGALSVGIGFGLQNIVNNFVSGLILLFERPVRRGDWIVVGTTEGYVKDISIRSTKIQTFDQSDVIVPNSELISNQVTNWMLSNNTGRLKSAVGVAYGSDVPQVMEVLKSIAENHPDVISNHPDFPIRVLFMNFGDSSLNFELRCFVKNVDNRLNIQSDINQGIDREFRKANIEIPFPQRVVHINEKDS